MAADVLKEKHPDFDWTCVGWSDIDKYACQMHDLVFPQYADKALGDITKIDWHKVKESLEGKEVDLFTYSSPCFVAGTLVLTDKGYKPIEEVTTDDYVLTHTGTYRKVTEIMVNKFYGNLHKIGVNGKCVICTPDHPFYIYNNATKEYEWEKACELGVGWDIAISEFDSRKKPLTASCEYNMTLIKREEYVLVYNLEVEEDHSYTANGAIVHNCQDISQAGKQMGLVEGSETRSALLWNVADAVEVLKPKYLLQENVAALVSDKFMPDFKKWLNKLETLGYVNRWALLNSKDYGVPQNRLRVFCLSMRKDVAFNYQFPEPIPLDKRLEDVLEEEVDEKYFLKDDAVGKFLKANDNDSSVFVQFALPPCHEDAMFLKTWLTFQMNENNGWELSPKDLEERINKIRPQFYTDYKQWQRDGKFPSDEFEKEYRINLERKNVQAS